MARHAGHGRQSDSRGGVRCDLCSKTFTHSERIRYHERCDWTAADRKVESSLTRHVKRCSQSVKGPARRKACRQCARSKLRCDLDRPRCGSCQERSIACEFAYLMAPSRLEPAPFTSSPSISTDDQSIAHPIRAFATQRQSELASSSSCAPSCTSEAQHVMHFIIRVLKSWARQLSVCKLEQLPPMIHRVQFEYGTPKPLMNCGALAGMWIDYKGSGGGIVFNCVFREIERLLAEVRSPQHAVRLC